MGGIPYYLDKIRKGRSAAQNIDALFFVENAALRDEFGQLYAALFEHHERHLKIIEALATKRATQRRCANAPRPFGARQAPENRFF